MTTSFLLLIVVTAAVHFRYRRVSAELIPGRLFDAWLWISILAIAFMGVYGIIALCWPDRRRGRSLSGLERCGGVFF